ncbi:MAG: hypothetical protein AAF673_03160 [Pseudomonadota bacterium]
MRSLESCNEDAFEVIRRFRLYKHFKCLSESYKKNNQAKISFIEESDIIAKGFDKASNRKSLKLKAITNNNVARFNQCVHIINHILSNCPDEYKEHIIDTFGRNCKNINSFRGNYYELKILSKLLTDGFTIESFPEAYSKQNENNISPPDAIISKNGKLLQVECKTISASKGHPIIQSAAIQFFNLMNNEADYNNICPKSQYCHIEFTFNKRLVEKTPKIGSKDIYTPETLLEQYREDLQNGTNNIKITHSKNQDIAKDTLSIAESVNSLSITISPKNSEITHKLTLISTVENTLFPDTYDLINNAITKNRKNDYPLIFCLELYDYGNRDFFEQLAPCLFYQNKDQPIWIIISDRAEKTSYGWQQECFSGRKPIEFFTKPMSEFLNTLIAE